MKDCISEVRAVGSQCSFLRMIFFEGTVAQGLEQSAHNRLVAGSNPASPTKSNLPCLGHTKFQWSHVSSARK